MDIKFIRFIKLLNGIRKRNSVKDVLAKISVIYAEKGYHGIIKGIKNKLNGRPLRSGFMERNDFYSEQQKEFDQLLMEHKLDISTDLSCLSVIVLSCDFTLRGLIDFIESLRAQVYKNWNLYVVFDDEISKDKINTIENYASKDRRVIVQYSEDYNDIGCIIKKVSGEYIITINKEGVFTRDAFYWIAKKINEDLNIDVIYLDEYIVDSEGKNIRYLNKPDWSKYFFIMNMCIGDVLVYSKRLFQKTYTTEERFELIYKYALFTRIAGFATKIIHIPRVLYGRKEVLTFYDDEKEALINQSILASWLKNQGFIGNVINRNKFFYPKIIYNSDRVSIVIIHKNNKNISRIINQIVDNTSHSNYEIIVFINDYEVQKMIELELKHIDNIKYCISNNKDKYFIDINQACAISTGNYIVYLDEYCYPNNSDWLESMLSPLKLPDVNVTSPAILDCDFRFMFAGNTIEFSNSYCILGVPYKWSNSKECINHEILNPLMMKETKGLSRHCFALLKKDMIEILNSCEIGMSINSLTDYIAYTTYNCNKIALYVPIASIICTNDDLTANKLSVWHSLFMCNNFFLEDNFFSSQMCKQLLVDGGEGQVKIYNNLSKYSNGKRVLLISHELSLTGAPIVALDTARELVSAGYNVVAASPFDGPLRKRIEELGIPVIIDVKLSWGRFTCKDISMFHNEWYMDYLVQDVDLVIVNSLCGHNLINRYESKNIPIMWWLHEGSFGYEIASEFLSDKLKSNIHVYCGGDYPKEMLNKYGFEYGEKVLLYGIDDRGITTEKKCNNKVVFLIVGTIERRKAQDLVFLAIEKMNKELLKQCEFIFLGNRSSDAVFDDISALEKKYDNVRILPPISREDLYQMYADMDCLICPSRDDPMPVVITESMMYSKTVICSTNVGQAKYINDGENGLVFQSDDADMLLQKISYVIENKDSLAKLGREARKLYEKNFSMEVFRKNLLSEVEGLISEYYENISLHDNI